jgi:hypothetical protein
MYTLADLFGCFSPKQPDNTVESVKASSSSDWVRIDKVGVFVTGDIRKVKYGKNGLKLK